MPSLRLTLVVVSALLLQAACAKKTHPSDSEPGARREVTDAPPKSSPNTSPNSSNAKSVNGRERRPPDTAAPTVATSEDPKDGTSFVAPLTVHGPMRELASFYTWRGSDGKIYDILSAGVAAVTADELPAANAAGTLHFNEARNVTILRPDLGGCRVLEDTSVLSNPPKPAGSKLSAVDGTLIFPNSSAFVEVYVQTDGRGLPTQACEAWLAAVNRDGLVVQLKISRTDEYDVIPTVTIGFNPM